MATSLMTGAQAQLALASANAKEDAFHVRYDNLDEMSIPVDPAASAAKDVVYDTVVGSAWWDCGEGKIAHDSS